MNVYAAISFWCRINNVVFLLAVVGAGIGGTSAAYFLRQKFGKDVQINIFEKGDVGGRLATIEMEGNHYEAGGSVIHPLNLHMKSFVKDLGKFGVQQSYYCTCSLCFAMAHTYCFRRV